MKKRMTHLQGLALVLSLLIVFAPLCSFAAYADTTTSSTASSTSSTTSSTSSSTTTTTTTTTTSTTTTMQPPVIGALSITRNGDEVKFIGPNGISGVDVTVDITSSDNPDVYFDMSLVGGSADTAARVCSKSGTVWECSLKSVALKSSTGEITIEVSASNPDGGRSALNITTTLAIDNVGPSVTFIGTDKVDSGISYAGVSGNTIIVKLNEAGAGLNNLNVFLDLAQFSGRSSVRANNCTQSGDEWSCYWFNVNAFGRESGAALPIKVMSTTKDDVGNAVTGISAGSAVLDRDAPVLLSNITIISAGAFGETAYHQSGDALVIIANVSDNTTKVSATADLSRIVVSGPSASPGACNLFSAGKYSCSWQTPAIKNGYFIAPITFNISDFVGNYITKTQDVEVFATTAESPDNFNLNIDYSDMIPAKGISRMVMTLLPNYLISVPFYLNGDADVLRLIVDNCSVGNDTSLYATYFQNQKNPTLAREATQSGQVNRAEFYFGYQGGRFSTAQINGLAGFNVRCNLNIFEKKGNIVYTAPEIEKFEFPVTLRESAIGGPPGIAVAEKIQSMKDNWWTEQKWITSVYKVLDTIEFWCTISKSIVYMWQNFLTLEFTGKAMVESNVPVVKEVGKVVYSLGCNLYEGFGGIVWTVWFGTKNPGGLKRCGTANFYAAPELPAPITTIDKALAYDKKFNLRYICGWATCEYAFADLSNITGGNLLNNLLSGVKIGEAGEVSTGTAAAGAAQPTAAATPAASAKEDTNNANYIMRRYLNIYPDDALNPRNSLLLSAASLCLPGVFYNLDKYRQINCKYILCLENVTTAGGDLSVCDESKSQAWCLTIWGEVFEVLGPARVLGVISQQIRNLFANAIPTGLDLIFKSTICTSSKGLGQTKSWSELLFCDLPSYYYTFIDNYNRLKGMGAISFKRPAYEDACSKVFGNETSSGDSGTTTTTAGSGISTITFGPTTTTLNTS